MGDKIQAKKIAKENGLPVIEGSEGGVKDIQEAKELPAPVIERMEFDMKDELIRQTIMDTQEDVDEIKEKLDKIDERLYEIQKNN